MWPHDFRDCYKLNIETGRYTLSSDFTRYIHDIRRWTMHNDFFHYFPDLQYDIPVSESVLRSPSSSRVRRQLARGRQSLDPRDDETASDCPSQPGDQATSTGWDDMEFDQSTSVLSFPIWAQTAFPLQQGSESAREAACPDILQSLYEQ
jgi:hypothetical protein